MSIYTVLDKMVELSREEINEMGRKVPYHMYVKFPVKIDDLYQYVDGFWLNNDGKLIVEYCKKMNHPYFYGLKIIEGL